MTTHFAQNEDKSRHAVVHGRLVQFFKRPAKRIRYASPQQVWEQRFENHQAAVEAADRWARDGKLPAVRRKATFPGQVASQ